ncbi:nucleotidyltransferase domain-containing protein [Clostridium sp. AL.422]|uniref:nucleotidyltransferase domain-containing protein n=1 Tax=Clostridium TaxID=1485 RepID=UPI00293DB0B4|nr:MULTISPECIES: nucleotidyltransferase domain-containing protein [unclassified Clostridium]MDV4152399.1 nucleotidyltransferase domain-containing protein [Clostridium sp. AL.422]
MVMSRKERFIEEAYISEEVKEKFNERNEKIIEAIIKKSEKVCQSSVALIGIYGSFLTGDIHEKSDLDLLIVINDNKGWQLGESFIQDDLEVGHDIYCTTWEALENDAEYNNPNISKLMCSKIVYCAEEKDIKRLEDLRKSVERILKSPFTEKDYERVEEIMGHVYKAYANLMTSKDLYKGRFYAGDVIYNIESAICLINKSYFKLGIKRAYDELEKLQEKPNNFIENIERIIKSDKLDKVKEYTTELIAQIQQLIKEKRRIIIKEKKLPKVDNLRGSYEEFFSNWRNKMYYAAETKNLHLAFMSMNSFQNTLDKISNEISIPKYNVFLGFNLEDLYETAKAFDNILNEYLEEYEKVGLKVNRYKNVNEFISHYIQN